MAEERINELEDRSVGIIQYEKQKEKKMKKIEQSLRDLWDTIKHINILIIEVPEKKRDRKGQKKYDHRGKVPFSSHHIKSEKLSQSGGDIKTKFNVVSQWGTGTEKGH